MWQQEYFVESSPVSLYLVILSGGWVEGRGYILLEIDEITNICDILAYY